MANSSWAPDVMLMSQKAQNEVLIETGDSRKARPEDGPPMNITVWRKKPFACARRRPRSVSTVSMSAELDRAGQKSHYRSDGQRMMITGDFTTYIRQAC